MLEQFVLAFVAGLLVKCVDWLDDVRKSAHPVKFALAAGYGVAIGYLIGVSGFSLLFLAALFAQVFARKIDTAAHRLGFALSILSLAYFGFPAIDFPLFAFFLIMAFLDEMEYVGALKPLSDYRPFLKLAGLAMVPFGRWEFFVGIMAFDLGYELFALLSKGLAGKRKK
ncbi:MAG: hypothetical protein AB1324_04775 [Candidatus Micrarchaeota archaeon]